MARTIADQLRHSSQLHGYDIDVHYHQGTAELIGTVADASQRETALRLVRGVPGVDHVIDRLQMPGTIIRVQAAGLERLQPLPSGAGQAAPQAQPQLPPVGPSQAPPNGSPLPPAIDSSTPGGGAPAAPPPPGAGQPGSATPLPAEGGGAPAAPAVTPRGAPEAVPSFQAAQPYPLNPPRMPPYAWPTYAPYNNYSRVAYPDSYPYQAFPYIGPIYPFPKIPPGWRSVKLEWEDGYWWFSKHATKWDWWRLRYW
jgi:hypothetical protein